MPIGPCTRRTLIAVLAVIAAGCAPGGTSEDAGGGGDDLRPVFAPETTAAANTDAATAAATGVPLTTVATGSAPAATTAPATPANEPPAVVDEVVTATIADRTGDTTPSPLDRPPAWADLAGATLTRRHDGFELRVKLGGAAPNATPDGDHTMNIASFYDVDGDGQIDYEVWANVGAAGWGGSWFDNRAGTARYADEAGVSWIPEGNELVMRFPLTHIGNATRFRWSVASEWGRYEVLGSPASVRDDAPDDDRPAPFG